MVDAVVCSRCGGPLPLEAAHRSTVCPFCSTVNAPAPTVIEKTIERIVVVAPVGATPKDGLRCPRCGVVMGDSMCGRTRIFGCGECGGVWLDPSAVDHARDFDDAELIKAAQLAAGIFVRAKPDKTRLVSCPVCAKALNRVRILGDSCDVDVCADHGTWFDRTELGSFVSAHASSRVGDITDDDLHAAGIGSTESKGDIGFFGAMFQVVGVFSK
jgi:Zn-finger nucleic acid-binding protein